MSAPEACDFSVGPVNSQLNKSSDLVCFNSALHWSCILSAGTQGPGTGTGTRTHQMITPEFKSGVHQTAPPQSPLLATYMVSRLRVEPQIGDSS